MALAREYYGCDDIEGVYLENEGGSGTVRLDKILVFTTYIMHFNKYNYIYNVYSSHWEKRTLHHEVMNGYISA